MNLYFWKVQSVSSRNNHWIIWAYVGQRTLRTIFSKHENNLPLFAPCGMIEWWAFLLMSHGTFAKKPSAKMVVKQEEARHPTPELLHHHKIHFSDAVLRGKMLQLFHVFVIKQHLPWWTFNRFVGKAQGFQLW